MTKTSENKRNATFQIYKQNAACEIHKMNCGNNFPGKNIEKSLELYRANDSQLMQIFANLPSDQTRKFPLEDVVSRVNFSVIKAKDHLITS